MFNPMRSRCLIPMIALLTAGSAGSAGADEKIGVKTEASTFLRRAHMAVNDGKYDEAVEQAGKAIQLDAKNGEAYLLRGQVYAAQRKHELAIADFNQVIKFNPKH